MIEQTNESVSEEMNLFDDPNRPLTAAEQMMMDAVNDMEVVSLKAGSVIESTYVKTTEKEILFDFGFKDYIRVENKGDEARVASTLEKGDTMNVAILSVTDRPEYTILGSISIVAKHEARENMITKMNSKTPVMAKVKLSRSGGYILEVIEHGVTLTGFMPNTLAGANRLSDPESIVGTETEVMIESYAKDKGNYIFSRRKFLETLMIKEVENLEFGQRDEPYVGTITGSTYYGIFVEFNKCLTGMIHKGHLNLQALKEAGFEDFQSIPEGTQIEFYVKEVLKNNRIILTQNFRESIWDNIKVGQTFEGTVISNKKYGVLVSLDDETKGLIKREELNNYETKLHSGDLVDVKVKEINKNSRNIVLNLL